MTHSTLFRLPASRSKLSIRDSYEEDRRSHSLDGDLILGPNSLQYEKIKNKSAWSKVKGIVANRNSRKSVKSTGSTNSRDVSPQDIGELSSSNQPSPSHIGVFNLNIPDNDYAGTSSGYSHQMSSDDNDCRPYEGKQSKSLWQTKKCSRKNKHVPDIESLVEGVPLSSNRKQIPNPLILQKVCIIVFLYIMNN